MNFRESMVEDEPLSTYSLRSGVVAKIQDHWFLVVLASAVVWGLYGAAMQLPLFFDDLVQFPYVERYTVFEHWLSGNESPYYRPLTVTIWKLLTLLPHASLPRYSHGLNLVLHTVNGVFVGVLARQVFSHVVPFNNHWIRRQMIQSVAVVLYLVMPFHYQAVPWAGALPQILVTTLVLAAVVSFLDDRFVLAWFLTLLAPMAHETGIVLPAIYLLFILINFHRLQWGEAAKTVSLFTTPTLLWLVVRFAVPTARDGTTLFAGWESLWQSVTWSFQGLFWPLTIFGRYIYPVTGLNDLNFIWLLGGSGLLAIWLLLILLGDKKKKLGQIFLIGAGWLTLTILPAIVVLPFGYIINSPRLMTLPGVGISFLWSAVIVSTVELLRQKSERLPQIFLLGLLALALGATITSILTVREEMKLHMLLGSAYDQIVDVAADEFGSPYTPVFINFPSSMAPAEKSFVLGNEGVVFWPQYAPQHTIITSNSGLFNTDYAFVTVEGIREKLPYFYGIVRPTAPFSDYEDRTDVVFYNTHYAADAIDILKAGQLTFSNQQPPLGEFAAGANTFVIQLLNAKVSKVQQANDPALALELDWHVATGGADNVTIFVHGVTQDGQLVAQADGDPLVGLLPLSKIAQGRGVNEVRYFETDPSVVAFHVGLYDRVSGERIPFKGQGDNQSSDKVIIPVLNQGN